MSITVSEHYCPQLQTKQDQFIMQTCHLERYTPIQQRDINMVRLYLQVNTLVDLTDATNFKAINLSFFDGQRPLDWIHSNKWPRQHPPSKQQIRLWKGYIRSSFLRYVPYWKINPTEKVINMETVSSSPRIHHDNIFSFIKTSLPPQHQRLLDKIEQVASDNRVWRACRARSRIYVASDGGLHKRKGTFGWLISTKKQVLFKCSGPVDGPFDTDLSTRCELCGLASSLLFLISLSRHWGLKHKCKVVWYCNSQAAIRRVQRFALHNLVYTVMPYDADLISMISSFRRELRTSFRPVWVKGHQDSLASYEKLSFSARLNVDADFLATRYRQRGRLHSVARVAHEPTQHCSVSINGERLTGQYDACIRYHINGYHLRQYLQGKNGWSDSVWTEIDFTTFGNHFRRMTPSNQVLHMKVVHNQLPLGDRHLRQSPVQEESLGRCPCCQSVKETTDHFLRCGPNPSHGKGIQELRSILKIAPNHPVFRILFAGVKHWLSNKDEAFTPDIRGYPKHLLPFIEIAIQSQARIGWYPALKGFLSDKWRDLASMDLFNVTKMDDQLGAYRMMQLVKKLYVFNSSMWKSRNEILHSNDSQTMAEIRSTETAETRHYFQNPGLLAFNDRHLCDGLQDSLLNGSASTRRRWLRRVKLSCELARKDSSRKIM